MITAAAPGNETAFLAACGSGNYLSGCMRADCACFGQKPASGWQFYLTDGGAIAVSPGGHAALHGHADPEELGSFLHFLGVHSLTAPEAQPCPEGYRPGEALTEFTEKQPLPVPMCRVSYQIETRVSPGEFAAVLSGLTGEQREDLYAQTCVRRNHGHSRLYGARVDGRLVCVVGVRALLPDVACMFAGETLPELREQGIGGGLIVSLANALLAEYRTPIFACRPERVNFYKRIGFTETRKYKTYIIKE